MQLLDTLSKVMAPITTLSAEELHEHRGLPGHVFANGRIFLCLLHFLADSSAGWVQSEPEWHNPGVAASFATVKALRDSVNQVVEVLRREKCVFSRPKNERKKKQR